MAKLEKDYVDKCNEGTNLFKKQNFKAACEKFTEAINLVSVLSSEQKLKMKIYRVYRNRGAAYLKMNQANKAIQDCNSAKEINASYCKCYETAAKAWLLKGHFSTAKIELKKHESCSTTLTDTLAHTNRIEREVKSLVEYLKQSHSCPCESVLTVKQKLQDCERLHGEVKLSKAFESVLVWVRAQDYFCCAVYDEFISDLDSLALLQEGLRTENSDISRLIESHNLLPTKEGIDSLRNIASERLSVMRNIEEAGNHTNAIASYTKALGMRPCHTCFAAKLYYKRALAKMTQSDNLRAIGDFCCAVSLSPSYSRAFTKLGEVLSEFGMFDDARKFLNEADINQCDKEKIRKVISDKETRGGTRGPRELLRDKEMYRMIAREYHPDKATSIVNGLDYKICDCGFEISNEDETLERLESHLKSFFQIVNSVWEQVGD